VELLLVPDDLRAFMRSVVDYLDSPAPDKFLDAEDAFQDECGYGGRIDGAEQYRFTYLSADGQHRWSIPLRESEIRAIADGLQIEAAAQKFDVVRTRHREASGDPLLVWGEYPDDALLVSSHDDLVAALELLHQATGAVPRMIRLWSTTDDQLIAVIWRGACALYVIESLDGYATSVGDASRNEIYEARDHDKRSFQVPAADFLSWPVASRALARFAAHGELGPEIATEGRIPSYLLMFGEVDRQTLLGMRPTPPRDRTQTSLSRLSAGVPQPMRESGDMTVPVSTTVLSMDDFRAWAKRLLARLSAGEWLELSPAVTLDELHYQLGNLLHAHGLEAEESLETADFLANEVKAIRGITKMFAAGGDMQLALRRTRLED
jgi:hypothetical protein